MHFHMTYSFELAGAYHCSYGNRFRDGGPGPAKSYPHITHDMQTVTIIDQPFRTCDCAISICMQSIKPFSSEMRIAVE